MSSVCIFSVLSSVYVILQLVTDIRSFSSDPTFKSSASRYIIIIYYLVILYYYILSRYIIIMINILHIMTDNI